MGEKAFHLPYKSDASIILSEYSSLFNHKACRPIYFFSFNAMAPSSHRPSCLDIGYSIIHQYPKGFQEWPASWEPQIHSAPGVKHCEEYYLKIKVHLKCPMLEHQ